MDYLPWPHGRMRLPLFIRRSMDKNEVLVSIRCLAYNHVPYISSMSKEIWEEVKFV